MINQILIMVFVVSIIGYINAVHGDWHIWRMVFALSMGLAAGVISRKLN